jgi:hypothetical protein
MRSSLSIAETNKFICLGFFPAYGCNLKHDKGIWWMPWYREAMKDVILCDKPRGAGNTL